VIGLRVSVPIACWRKGHAREFLESEALPPPSTCYGALLSLVGEQDIERHRGVRVTAGLLNEPARSVVLRTLWQIKQAAVPQGRGANAGPDLQQLVVGADLVVWCSSRDEPANDGGLEIRIRKALSDPTSVRRFGGWSIGESTHLVNDLEVLADARPPSPCHTFVVDPAGTVTLPIWVDHVGSMGTRYAVGRFDTLSEAPSEELLPQVPLEPVGQPVESRRRRH
jgi:CRISPR-associated protein Cas5t